MKGYIQLVDTRTGNILGQRKGLASDTLHHVRHTWKVRGELEVIFAQESVVVQPFKFFRPVPKEDLIRVYYALNGGVEPPHSPGWTGSAYQLDEPDSFLNGSTVSEWEAYTSNGEWVGTSES